MFNYIVRRLAIACVTLLLISFIVYGLIRNMPGSPLTLAAAEMVDKGIQQADVERMRRNMGLDKHWVPAYGIWLSNVAQGDFGRSIHFKRPVLTVIGERMGPTLLLSGTSLVLAYLIAVPIGLWSTARSGKLDERIVSTLLYMLYSLPSLVAALLLLWLFAITLRGTMWELPLGRMASNDYDQLSLPGKLADLARHALLPIICFTYGSLAYYSRFVKSNMEEVVRQDYIRTARAKGVDRRTVIVHHAFRNTLIPFVTLLGLSLPGLLGGSVILERIFTWPGMGQLYFEALTQCDYPVIMGLTLMFSVLTLAGQLLADILYAVADPRVTYH